MENNPSEVFTVMDDLSGSVGEMVELFQAN